MTMQELFDSRLAIWKIKAAIPFNTNIKTFYKVVKILAEIEKDCGLVERTIREVEIRYSMIGNTGEIPLDKKSEYETLVAELLNEEVIIQPLVPLKLSELAEYSINENDLIAARFFIDDKS